MFFVVVKVHNFNLKHFLLWWI